MAVCMRERKRDAFDCYCLRGFSPMHRCYTTDRGTSSTSGPAILGNQTAGVDIKDRALCHATEVANSTFNPSPRQRCLHVYRNSNQELLLAPMLSFICVAPFKPRSISSSRVQGEVLPGSLLLVRSLTRLEISYLQ
jgi:hypothetical protein